ncbi:hypothetical protein HDU76_010045 [Blyttiomyces sp. JEL0837]|nr:hypothetical protein HDU76_010045 [Blyttiomyces sp. JEL0837]
MDSGNVANTDNTQSPAVASPVIPGGGGGGGGGENSLKPGHETITVDIRLLHDGIVFWPAVVQEVITSTPAVPDLWSTPLLVNCNDGGKLSFSTTTVIRNDRERLASLQSKYSALKLTSEVPRPAYSVQLLGIGSYRVQLPEMYIAPYSTVTPPEHLVLKKWGEPVPSVDSLAGNDSTAIVMSFLKALHICNRLVERPFCFGRYAISGSLNKELEVPALTMSPTTGVLVPNLRDPVFNALHINAWLTDVYSRKWALKMFLHAGAEIVVPGDVVFVECELPAESSYGGGAGPVMQNRIGGGQQGGNESSAGGVDGNVGTGAVGPLVTPVVANAPRTYTGLFKIHQLYLNTDRSVIMSGFPAIVRGGGGSLDSVGIPTSAKAVMLDARCICCRHYPGYKYQEGVLESARRRKLFPVEECFVARSFSEVVDEEKKWLKG